MYHIVLHSLSAKRVMRDIETMVGAEEYVQLKIICDLRDE